MGNTWQNTPQKTGLVPAAKPGRLRGWLGKIVLWVGTGMVCLLAVPAAILLTLIGCLWSVTDRLAAGLEGRK